MKAKAFLHKKIVLLTQSNKVTVYYDLPFVLFLTAIFLNNGNLLVTLFSNPLLFTYFEWKDIAPYQPIV